MLKTLKYSLFLALQFISIMVYSQFYNTGSAPFKAKWQSINTEHFQLIYPIEIDSLAQKYASTLTQLYPYTSYTLDHKPSKVDIIMYNQSVKSNAYVVWAPKRMELVTTSPQKQYAHDWLEQLALHEYRHVVQIDKLNQGFTKGLSWFTGEMGVGAMTAFVPLWFLEGDAVVTETALTNTGRGRDPGFIQEVMATEMQEKKRFRYDEFYLGSYKNYVPNYYNYGYHMVAWSRMQYGNEVWSKVLNNVGRRPFTLAPFYFQLKKETGLSKVQLYEKTSDYLHQEWLKEDSLRRSGYIGFDTIQTSYKSKYVSYRFPYQSSDGSVLALRTSIDDIAKLVQIANGKEKVLFSLGSFQGSKIAYSDKYIAWQEIQNSPRWERKNFSVIRLFNRETNQSSIFKKQTKHFAPSISPSSKKICVVNNNVTYNSLIEIYEIETKELLQKFMAEQGRQFSFPVWLDEDRIAVVVLSNQGKAIELLDTRSGNWTQLLEPGFENISYLTARNNKIYYSSTLDGRLNIYEIEIDSRKIDKISSSAIGINFASINTSGDSLLCSEYTSQGYKLRKVGLESGGTVLDRLVVKPYKYNLAEANAAQEKINIQDSILPGIKYDSKPYSKGGHMFNIHSWFVPFYINLDALPDEQSRLYPGLTLLSQNSLSTVTSGFSYYYSDGHHHIRPNISFRMFYPVIRFDYLYGGAPRVNTQLASPGNVSEQLSTYQEYNTEISVPLNFSNSRLTHTVVPSIRYTYSNSYVADSNKYSNVDFEEDEIYYYKGKSNLDFRLQYKLASKLAYKDLQPRWGLSYFGSYIRPVQHKQYWSENHVHIFTAYLPGLYRHHSSKLLFGIEKDFGNRLTVPRGYNQSSYINFDQTNKVTLEYAMPLFYPNLSLGPLAYFKRVQLAAYYDQFSNDSTFEPYMSSIGAEVGIETNFFRFFWTFVPTIQYNYLIERDKSNWGFFFTTKYGFSLGRIQ